MPVSAARQMRSKILQVIVVKEAFHAPYRSAVFSSLASLHGFTDAAKLLGRIAPSPVSGVLLLQATVLRPGVNNHIKRRRVRHFDA